MPLVKTPLGVSALKDRHGLLTPRQRSAFILFDGKRSTVQVLEATAAMGITTADVQAMMDQGLLAQAEGIERAPTVPAAASGAVPLSARSFSERYQAAYQVATELTASLGLRGFRLNLAVEGATSLDDLAALAPKIREAVGDAKYARLKEALFA